MESFFFPRVVELLFSIQLGILPANIVAWMKNGIEYYYPSEILAAIFACSVDQLDTLAIVGEVVSLNGITKTNNEVVKEVLKQMDSATGIPAEFEENLLRRVEHSIQ
jgi:hypothetical protein